jgi:6-phosphogluconolactonase (cycloisomerase 2 family)
MRCEPKKVVFRGEGRLNAWRGVFSRTELAMIASGLLALLAVACAGGGGAAFVPPAPPPPAGEFFYVANLSQFVSGFSVQSGHLAVIPGSGTMLPFPPINFAADPKGQFLGLVEFQNITTLGVQLVAIQPGGTLMPGAQVPVMGAASLAFSGNNLLAVIDQSGEQVEVFAIQNGALSLVSSAPTGALPADVLFSTNNRALYVANSFGDSISVYSVSASGTIQPLQTLPLPFAAGQVIAPVERLRLNPAGDKLAAVTAIGQLYVSRVNTTDGTLSATQETIVADGANLEEVIFDPSGKNIYTGDLDNGGLYEFAVAADGSTTPLPGSPLPTRTLLSGMAINSAGDRLYAVTEINSEIATFLRDTATGNLMATTEVVNSGGFLPGRIVRVPAH